MTSQPVHLTCRQCGRRYVDAPQYVFCSRKCGLQARLRSQDHAPHREPHRAECHEQRAKARARWAVNDAKKLGRIAPGPCERASADCRGALEAHHDDYAAPLAVRWLCRRHHLALHRRRVPA